MFVESGSRGKSSHSDNYKQTPARSALLIRDIFWSSVCAKYSLSYYFVLAMFCASHVCQGSLIGFIEIKLTRQQFSYKTNEILSP